ncbi:MAG: hypothetical protein PHY08_11895 [Candidatus Cloacimonetes bacterium]|nr:hypothetical protein [Candidatus Cloacimonadota bacterium]
MSIEAYFIYQELKSKFIKGTITTCELKIYYKLDSAFKELGITL